MPDPTGFDRSLFMQLEGQRTSDLAAQRPSFDNWRPPHGDHIAEFVGERFGQFKDNKSGGPVSYASLQFRIAEGDSVNKKFDEMFTIREGTTPYLAAALKVMYGEETPENLVDALAGLPTLHGKFFVVRSAPAPDGQHTNIYINESVVFDAPPEEAPAAAPA